MATHQEGTMSQKASNITLRRPANGSKSKTDISKQTKAVVNKISSTSRPSSRGFTLFQSVEDMLKDKGPLASCGTKMTRKLCETADSRIFGKYFWVCEHNPGAFVMESAYLKTPNKVNKCRFVEEAEDPLKLLFNWIIKYAPLAYTEMDDEEKRTFCNGVANWIRESTELATDDNKEGEDADTEELSEAEQATQKT